EAAAGGVLWTLLLGRVAALPVLAAVAVAVRAPLVPAPRDAARLAGIGAFDLGATGLYALATTKGLLAVVAVLGALYPVTTVLLALGLTGPVLQPLLRIRALDRLRVLTHPLVALPLWALSLYLWHLDALYVGSVHHPALHALQHACFVGFGVAMWMPLFGPLPKPVWFGNLARLVYIIAVRLTGAILGNVLIWSNTVLYPGYAGDRSWGITPLQDQNV